MVLAVVERMSIGRGGGGGGGGRGGGGWGGGEVGVGRGLGWGDWVEGGKRREWGNCVLTADCVRGIG